MNAQKDRMYKDVELLTGVRPFRNYRNLASLRFVANYIKSEFIKAGLECEEQVWTAKGNEYKNVIASYNTDKHKRLIVGAHYDVFDEQAGADDNASGIAGLLESARLIAEQQPDLDYRIDFVAYCLEEPPFFGTKEMGSYVHAKSLKNAKVDVLGMICYEMIGYFSDVPGSQPNPVPELIDDIPDTGDFIVVAGIRKYKEFNKRVHALMTKNEKMDTRVINFPTKLGLAGLSDHSSYWKCSFPALMITDTALVRNSFNYHSISDTIHTLDFDKMTEVVNSSYIAITKLDEMENGEQKNKKPKYDPASRNINMGATEGKRYKKLGDFGEILAEQILPEHGFDKVRNLNLDQNNFKYADFYAEKDGKKYLISVKTRNKFEHTGALNSRYKLGRNLEQKIEDVLKKPEFTDCIPAWLTIAMEKTTFDAYFGLISDLRGNHGISMSEKACASYLCLAKGREHEFDSDDFLNIYQKK